MKTTENVKIDFKALREKAGLTLEALAGKIDYSVAAVNGLENNDSGSKRLRNLVLSTLTPLAAEAVAGPDGGGNFATTTPAEERARRAEEKLDRVYALLAEMVRVLKEDEHETGRGPRKSLRGRGNGRERRAAKPGRTRFRDDAEVSLRIFGSIPAGWPQNFDESRCAVRYEPVPRGRFPEGAFGLDVRGDSMNAAGPEPILDGETVVLLSPEQREPRHGDIVAALCDGQTTLKRLQCPPGKTCVLRAESTNPVFAREIVPVEELTIQGVVVGKL